MCLTRRRVSRHSWFTNLTWLYEEKEPCEEEDPDVWPGRRRLWEGGGGGRGGDGREELGGGWGVMGGREELMVE